MTSVDYLARALHIGSAVAGVIAYATLVATIARSAIMIASRAEQRRSERRIVASFLACLALALAAFSLEGCEPTSTTSSSSCAPVDVPDGAVCHVDDAGCWCAL